MIYYWMSCFALLRRHRTNIQLLSSFTENIDLKWLSYLLASVLVLICIRLLSLFITKITAFSPILYFAGIIVLAYTSLTQQSIYLTESSLPVEKDEIEAKKEHNERLTPAQVSELQRIILQKTQDEKLYLNPQLTLSALALKTGITTHELSYVLNTGLGKNFYQFINELRIQEAKALLLSDDLKHIDLLGMGLKAGFNSKTTFYTTFKKATHLTPKQYIKTHTQTT
ncbi:AraC family transcriptional regulator [Siphonobacter sp. BAB-5385]|uniref:helix-turn-helix domain-containing protein n=1 Tax=Siphonobacter sp. BAB-5385 TaxID=1864822 RepID=UPI0015951EF8|nr:helix-turn-helix domain-containing protein [Siphonobacter sp. BAB-5385]